MHISNQKAKTLSNTFISFEEMNDHIVSCLDIDRLLKLTNCFLMTLCGFYSIPANTAGLIALFEAKSSYSKMIPFSSCPMFG